MHLIKLMINVWQIQSYTCAYDVWNLLNLLPDLNISLAKAQEISNPVTHFITFICHMYSFKLLYICTHGTIVNTLLTYLLLRFLSIWIFPTKEDFTNISYRFPWHFEYQSLSLIPNNIIERAYVGTVSAVQSYLCMISYE
jgi:hypothetical protein